MLTELDQLVGLQRVKEEIGRLIQFVHVQELRREEGISTARPSLHSVFYGSPGTGKTTVARLYGRILHAMGILSQGHLVETDRAGLVGSYIGQTANKADDKIREALGGVLFIDEAYSLSRGDNAQWDYGSEAIEILMKRMEDNRDDLVVIAAGYPGPMEVFLSSNEGLRSRFSTFVHFDDFGPEDLLAIFRHIASKENYGPTEEATERVLETISRLYEERDNSFGNARLVRNLFETAIRNQALRLSKRASKPSQADLETILPEDIPAPPASTTKQVSRIGFNRFQKEDET